MPTYQNESTSTMEPQTARQNWAGEVTAPGSTNLPGWSGPWTPMDTRFPQARTGSDLQMQNNLSPEVIEFPTNLTEAHLGSLKANLLRNRGNFIVATFLIGTQNTVSWEGILYEVGNDYVTIYQPGRDRYVVIDMYSLKYMEFYDTQRRELCNQLLAQRGYATDAMPGMNGMGGMSNMGGMNSMPGMGGMNGMAGMNHMNGMDPQMGVRGTDMDMGMNPGMEQRPLASEPREW